jgi:hypothetical protein
MLESKESINNLREDLYSILEQKIYDLSDPQVIEASENINNAIAAYSSLSELKTG